MDRRWKAGWRTGARLKRRRRSARSNGRRQRLEGRGLRGSGESDPATAIAITPGSRSSQVRPSIDVSRAFRRYSWMTIDSLTSRGRRMWRSLRWRIGSAAQVQSFRADCALRTTGDAFRTSAQNGTSGVLAAANYALRSTPKMQAVTRSANAVALSIPVNTSSTSSSGSGSAIRWGSMSRSST